MKLFKHWARSTRVLAIALLVIITAGVVVYFVYNSKFKADEDLQSIFKLTVELSNGKSYSGTYNIEASSTETGFSGGSMVQRYIIDPSLAGYTSKVQYYLSEDFKKCGIGTRGDAGESTLMAYPIVTHPEIITKDEKGNYIDDRYAGPDTKTVNGPNLVAKDGSYQVFTMNCGDNTGVYTDKFFGLAVYLYFQKPSTTVNAGSFDILIDNQKASSPVSMTYGQQFNAKIGNVVNLDGSSCSMSYFNQNDSGNELITTGVNMKAATTVAPYDLVARCLTSDGKIAVVRKLAIIASDPNSIYEGL